MSAIEKVHDNPAARPTPAEVTGWLLEGRWFTIDTGGKITSWSPAATERFGWQRKDIGGADFVDTLLAPSGRQAGGEALASALDGAAADHLGAVTAQSIYAYVERGFGANVMPETYAQLPEQQLDALVQYLLEGNGG
jgi:hypothetical protein